MSTTEVEEVENAVKFAIEDIEESVDLLGDEDYLAALHGIRDWVLRQIEARSLKQI